MHPPLHVLPADEALAGFAAQQIAAAARHAVRRRGQFTIALSGGTTPRRLLSLLAGPPHRDGIPWAHVHVFWSDERCVPPDSPDSNYGLAREALLEHVAVPSDHVHRLDTALGPESAAAEYSRRIEAVAGRGGLDLVLLGIGEDGHTASLFPGSPLLGSGARGAAACLAPSSSAWRITLTPAEINSSRAVRYLVAGSAKADVTACVLRGRSGLPAGDIVPASGDIAWWLDGAAAARIVRPGLRRVIETPSPAPTVDAFEDEGNAVPPRDGEALKRAAGEAAAALVTDGVVVGLGTGSTVRYTTEAIARRLATGDLLDVVGVPTSSSTTDLARRVGVPLVTLEDCPALDLAIDGADEIGPELALIKGLGGALVREKIVAGACRTFVVVADDEKCVRGLGMRAPLPVAVVPFGWSRHVAALRALGAEPALRRTGDGEPLLTDDGLYVIDAGWSGGIPDAAHVERSLGGVTGIVATGLFLDVARIACIATPSGIVVLHRG